MNNKDDKYSELINQIKTLDVKLPNEQELAEKIIASIEFLAQKKNDNKILRIISFASSIAASLLIGLFIIEQYFTSINMECESLNTTSVYAVPFPEKNIYCEKTNTPYDFNKWIQIKERQAKRQSFYSNIISKYKTS